MVCKMAKNRDILPMNLWKMFQESNDHCVAHTRMFILPAVRIRSGRRTNESTPVRVAKYRM